MIEAPSAAFEIHTTGTKQHIDAVALGPAAASDLCALATSSLTGDVWDGTLAIIGLPSMSLPSASAQVVASVATAGGNSDVAWLNCETLATGDDRGDLTIWELSCKAEPTCKAVVTFGEHSQPVTSVAASAVPSRVASSSLDGTAKIWAATVAGGAVGTLEHLPLKTSWAEVQVHSAAWLDASAQLLATGASDGVARVWDLRLASPAATRLAPHTASLLRIASGAHESQLLAASECGSLLLLDQRKPDAAVAQAAVHADAPLCALSVATGGGGGGAAPMTPSVAVGAEDGSVVLLDPSDLHALAHARPHAARVGGLAWVRAHGGGAGSVLLSGGWDKRLVRLEFAGAV